MADPADDEPDIASPVAAEDDDAGSVVERVKDLADDTRTAIEAELAWQGARASYVGGRVGGIAGLAAFALLCVFIAILSLAFGAILALSPMIGPALATVVVVAALLVIAAISGLMARFRVLRLKRSVFPPKSPDTAR